MIIIIIIVIVLTGTLCTMVHIWIKTVYNRVFENGQIYHVRHLVLLFYSI